MTYFLTTKDVTVLKAIKKNNGKKKNDIARTTKYLPSDLRQPFKKLEYKELITIKKDKITEVRTTEAGNKVLSRL